MNIKDIEPAKGHILVELFEAPTKSGDIILAGDQANNAPVRGVIIRINESYAGLYKVGEEIFYRKYAIDELTFTKADSTEETVFIVDENEVLGAVRPIEEKLPDNTADVRQATKEADHEQVKAGKKK